MRAFTLLALAGLAIVPFSGASAQQPSGGSLIDCGNPQNALTYYCNNRDAVPPVVVAPAPDIIVQPDVPVTGSVALPEGRSPAALDCGNPQNALTYYCNNRDQFLR